MIFTAHDTVCRISATLLLMTIACSSRTKIPSGGTDDPPREPTRNAVTNVPAAVPDLIADVVLDPARLPAGAVAQIGQPRFVLGGALRSLSVRDDGSVFGHGFNYARLWDGATGLARWSMQTRGHAFKAAAARRADVIAISEESRLTVIDARTGAQLVQRLFNTVNAVAISPDGRHVLVMTGTLSLTDLASGDALSPPTRVTAIAGLVRDDRSVIAVQGDCVLRWNGTKDGPVETAATLPARPRMIAFDASGERVAWATGDHFGLVDLASGAAFMDVERPGVKIETLAVSPDGSRVATGLAGRLLVWEAGKSAPSWEHPVRYKSPPPAAFLADGDVLVGDLSSIVRLSPDGQARPRAPVVRFTGFAGDGTLIVDIDGKKTGIDVAQKREVPAGTHEEEPIPEGAPDWVDRAVVSSDGSVIAWSEDEGTECDRVRVWRSKGGLWTSGKPRTCDGEGGLPYAWVMGPGMLVDVSEASPVVWDTATGQRVLEIPAGSRKLHAVIGVPDLDLVVVVFLQEEHHDLDDPYAETVDPGFYLELWSRKSSKKIATATAPAERAGVAAAEAGRDGAAVYIGWSDGTVDALVLRSAELRTLGRHLAAVRVVDESPASRMIATLDDDGLTFIWLPQDNGAREPR
jgi:WD40 repeat protein